MGRNFRIYALASLTLFAAGYAGVRWVASPDFVFLVHSGDAKWIRIDRPMKMSLLPLGVQTEIFHTEFSVNRIPDQAVLRVKALRSVDVRLDGQTLLAGPTQYEDWKMLHEMDLTPHLKAGATHKLELEVENLNGTVAVIARCDALGIATGPGWKYVRESGEPGDAVSIDDIQPPDFSREFPRTDRALFRSAPILLPVFLLVALWRYQLLSSRGPAPWLGKFRPSPSGVRWIVMAAWVVLALNNVWKIPWYFGYDVQAHVEHVAFIAENRALPIATDGFEMFQAPLYYVLSVPIYLLASPEAGASGIIKALRFIPLLCGIAQVELCYRAGRLLFENERLQNMTTVLGAFVPINLYISHYASNEPLGSALSSASLVMALGFIARRDKLFTLRDGIALGTVFGAALLAKASSVLLALPLGVACVWLSVRTRAYAPRTRATSLIPALAVFATAGVIAGWWYVRNLVLIGTPFGVGFDPELGIVWRQDPGYRSLSQLLSFGESLRYPVYSGFHGFWDSIYSTMWFDGWLSGSPFPSEDWPPWNYNLALAICLLSVLPAAGAVVGFVLCLVRSFTREGKELAFVALSVGTFAAALLYYYLDMPIFGVGKASYSLGALPAFAAVGAIGMGFFQRHRVGDVLVTAVFACWAVGSYLAYFVVR